MRWDLGPNDGLIDQDLANDWFNFFNINEHKLSDLIILRRRFKLAKIETKITELKELLCPFKDSLEYKAKSTQIQKFIEKTDKDIKAKKIKKYQRDLKDYGDNSVYQWQEDVKEATIVSATSSLVHNPRRVNTVNAGPLHPWEVIHQLPLEGRQSR